MSRVTELDDNRLIKKIFYKKYLTNPLLYTIIKLQKKTNRADAEKEVQDD